jgi:predicted kinase
MSTLIITVGIPGCGKSTWAEMQNAEVVSSDAIREELCGDPTDQSRNSEVFALFHARIASELAKGETVIADSTGLDRFARDKLRDIGEETHATIVLVYWDNANLATRRNETRARRVPSAVMERMIDKLDIFMTSGLPVERDLYDVVLRVE